MTAEIGIMNKQAVALAADSAVTFRTEKGQKIFVSANKIFCLCEKLPVGIMIYGNASILQVPWEIVIKTYGKHLGNKKFNKLSDYCNDFLNYLAKNKTLFPETEQKKYISGNIEGYFTYLRKKISDTIKEKLENQKTITKKEIADITTELIEAEYKSWKKTKLLPKVTAKRVNTFQEKYEKVITAKRKEIFEKLPITDELVVKLSHIAAWLFFKFHDKVSNVGTSGLVIAGYGENDIFPSLCHYNIEGVVEDFLKYRQDGNSGINSGMDAAILPFAQKEMVVRFIEGIDPTFLGFINAGLIELSEKYPELILDKLKLDKELKKNLNDQIVKDIKNSTKEFLLRFKEIRREHFINPILQVVGILPKDELAIMAETLITLTSFKRRVSMEDETVGGPVDVVVISKGDGFVWVKRKKYFDKNIQN